MKNCIFGIPMLLIAVLVSSPAAESSTNQSTTPAVLVVYHLPGVKTNDASQKVSRSSEQSTNELVAIGKKVNVEEKTLVADKKAPPSLWDNLDGDLTQRIPGTGMAEDNFRYSLFKRLSVEYNSRYGASSSPREPEIQRIGLRLDWKF